MIKIVKRVQGSIDTTPLQEVKATPSYANHVRAPGGQQAIRQMMLVVYKEGDLHAKLYVKPILDRFTSESAVTPRQLSAIVAMYLRLKKGL